jgi:hypothetical protein
MTEIAQLESSALFWDWVSYISLIIAFLAALAEFITNWTTWIEDDWKSKVEKNASLIVVVGSVVGLVTAWKLSNINNRLNDHLRGEVAGAQEKAGQAMTAFANAQTRLEEGKARTALAEKAAAEALKKANEAEGHALKFKAEIASSNARAEEAKLLAERERSERVKLEANVAPRRLTQQQQNAMAKSLRQFKGRSVTVVTYTLDVEAAFLAKQLMIALEAAGIVIEDKVANILTAGSFYSGIFVSGPVDAQDFLRELVSSIERDGNLAASNNESKPVVPVAISKLKDKAVFILVGVKPARLK